MTNDSLPPFSVRNRREIAPIDEIFPASAQIGLLHLLNEGMSRGFLTDWEKVAMELQRIARLPPRNYSSHREAQAEIQQLLDLLSWERQYDFCERLYSHLASASEYEDNGYVVRTEKSEAQQFFADELQRLFQEENLAFEFRDGLAQRRGRRHKGRTATMQIGELAKRTALTVDAIRFYEKRRLLPKPVRSTGRFRLYTVDDMERVRFIQQV
jgi:hypothetical protein